MPQIIEINDLTSPAISVYSQLTETQLRNRLEPEKGIFIAESPKVIKVALDEGYVPLSLLTERKHIEGQYAPFFASFADDIPIYTGDHNLLTALTGYELTRGVLCAMRRPRRKSLEEVCRDASRIAVLDNVVNATNTGTIFRTATALGLDAIVLTPTCSDPLNRRAVRVSMGTVFQIPWTYIGDTPSDWTHNGMNTLHNLGFKTIAMALTDNSVNIDDPAIMAEPKLAIVLGTEGDGLPSTTINKCDYVVRIPMHHGVDSLNVAVAGAIAFWQLRMKN